MSILEVTSESTGVCPECGYQHAIYTDHLKSGVVEVDCSKCGYLGEEKELQVEPEILEEYGDISEDDW